MVKTVQTTCLLYRLPNSRLSGGRTVTPMVTWSARVCTTDGRPDKGRLCQAGSIVDTTSAKSVQTIDQFMSKLSL